MMAKGNYPRCIRVLPLLSARPLIKIAFIFELFGIDVLNIINVNRGHGKASFEASVLAQVGDDADASKNVQAVQLFGAYRLIRIAFALFGLNGVVAGYFLTNPAQP
jgi:hypothetical protein